MQSHRARSYAALLALVTTTAVAQFTTPKVPSNTRCAGLIGSALDSCMQSSRDASLDRTTPGRVNTSPSAPGMPRNIVEPAPPIKPGAPSSPRNIVEPIPDKGRIK